MSHFKCDMKFLSLMSQTQLFAEYFEKVKDPVSISESNKQAALLIADWVWFRWTRNAKMKQGVLLLADWL